MVTGLATDEQEQCPCSWEGQTGSPGGQTREGEEQHWGRRAVPKAMWTPRSFSDTTKEPLLHHLLVSQV